MGDVQPPKIGKAWLDAVVAASAILISLVSLWVAVGANRTQERLLSASVWPYLQYGTSDISPPGTGQIDFTLQNAGVGPARVRWVTLYYHKKAYPNAQAALRACCGSTGNMPTTTEGLQGRVLTATQTIPFIHLPRQASDAKVFAKLDVARHDFELRACYCSTLDECWMLDGRNERTYLAVPQRVPDCPPPELPLFQG